MTAVGMARREGWRRGYVGLAVAFAIGIAVQVFFAGAAIVHDHAFWRWHVLFAPFLEVVALALLVVALIGRRSARYVMVPVLLVFLVMFQYASMSFRPSIVAAFHPVNALVLFVLPLAAAWALQRGGRPAPHPHGPTEEWSPRGSAPSSGEDLVHVRVLAVLSLFLGLVALVGAAQLVLRRGDEVLFLGVSLIVFLVALIAVSAGVGLALRRAWGRWAAYVAGALVLVAFPLGTAYALYVFLGLNRRGVDHLLRGRRAHTDRPQPS